MIKTTVFSILSVSLCLPALAEESDENKRDAELRRMREKETNRAMESAQDYENIKKYEERYEWAKEDFKFEYDGMIAKRKAAFRAWQQAAEQLKRANRWEDVHAIKMPAYQAAALAYLAERELKAKGSERHWLNTAERAGTQEAKQAANALIENQRKLLDATRQKLAREHELRQLEHTHNQLDHALEEQYERAKRQQEQKQSPEPKPETKPEAKPAPPKVLIE